MTGKRTNMMKVMMTDKEKEAVLNTVEELKSKGYQTGINASDLMRQGVKKWISIYQKIEEGNALCFMPVSKEIIDNKRAMLELESLSKDEKLSLHTRKVLSEMSDRIEWEVLSQLKEKYPEHSGFFNLSSLEKDI